MDLHYLRPIYAQPGPWASVYLDASRSDESGGREVELRWRALAQQLAELGADQPTIEVIGDTLLNYPTQEGRYGLAAFARAGRVALVEPMNAPPPADEARYSALPHAMPLVALRGEDVPYVRVLVDRSGADLEGLAVATTPRLREVDETVRGREQYPLHKAHAGGQDRRGDDYRVDEIWKRNAGDVAGATAELAEAVGAEVVVVGGDVRTVPMFVEKLPKRWQERTVRTDAGSRAPGADEDALDDVTIQAIADVADRHTQAAIDRYQVQRGEHVSATGLPDVVAALQRRQVETVLMVNDLSSTDTLFIGRDDPSLIALDADTLIAEGVEDPLRVRADQALLRAITGTDAELVLVGPDEAPLEHGIGAVMRWADQPAGV
ncbi:Vms1/Ankzf1 family peptidyl-tRNA hydrolase [Asanoa sp. WMMD1127]|uniref:baeRF2 domain-containing protein n=1 Tax=Asanoa sp. WMMD1127 TaxID=3016107 RepID=UPI002416117C|nr:Vms1/Ankzf1 family peptidyl-tRNA hydrolase [Asanoa sp. WMMD1127]MDG4826319.1 Vms1/Ankzf1 family peptidyl-tRNA hydrolase [Asanoa sp. WMMD1127]